MKADDIKTNTLHFGNCPDRGKSASTRQVTRSAQRLGKEPIKILLVVLITALALAVSAAEAGDRTEYRTAQTAAGSQGAASNRISIRDPSQVPQCPNQGPVVLTPCAVDETLVLFDQPVYDNKGLFVICLEKRPYCVPSSLEPQGDAPAGVDGMTMRAMLSRFNRGGYTPPRTLLDLAFRTRPSDPLADTTITCNDSTNICTCLSDTDGDCVAKLASICGSAEPFGSNGGVGTDCPTVQE